MNTNIVETRKIYVAWDSWYEFVGDDVYDAKGYAFRGDKESWFTLPRHGKALEISNTDNLMVVTCEILTNVTKRVRVWGTSIAEDELFIVDLRGVMYESDRISEVATCLEKFSMPNDVIVQVINFLFG